MVYRSSCRIQSYALVFVGDSLQFELSEVFVGDSLQFELSETLAIWISVINSVEKSGAAVFFG